MSDVALGGAAFGSALTRPTHEERRKHPRIRIFLPVQVHGHSTSGSAWSESTRCEDASRAGCAFLLGTTVLTGQVLSILLPLPRGLRRYDHVKPTYETYAIVKSAPSSDGPIRVGVSFLGKMPPPGYAESPGARFLTERRRAHRQDRYIKVRLAREAGVPETTVLENVGGGGARVMTGEEFRAGELVTIEGSDGLLKARGEVRGVYVGQDGIRRLSIRFID